MLKDNEEIHKCLFVVDRKDLDRQTREGNTNTGALVRPLLAEVPLKEE